MSTQDSNPSQAEQNTATANESELLEARRATRQRSLPFRFRRGDVLDDRFVIIRFLGRGGMGEVYEAEDRFFKEEAHIPSDVRVALKTLSPEGAATPGALDRFKKEVLLARHVSHPHVCPIYDVGSYESSHGVSFFLTMKLLSGVTLRERLANGPLPVEEGVILTRQVASALNALHREGIVHRDFKPSNIMVQGSGQEIGAVVTDFGLARKSDSEFTVGSDSQFYGTPGYVAPELLFGQPVTPACDLYSFAVVLHQVFCGEKPLKRSGRDAATATQAFLTSGAPDFCKKLVISCLSIDPTERCRTFVQFLPELDPATEPSRSSYNVARPWSRRQVIAASGAAAFALGAGVYKEWDEISDFLFNPLPVQRFVALILWPPPPLKSLNATLNGLINAMESELSRVEAFDRNLLVIAAPPTAASASAAGGPDGNNPGSQSPQHQLAEVRDSLGANLILAASGAPKAGRLQVSLKLMDPSSTRTLRQRHISSQEVDFAGLASQAVLAAASLLHVSRYVSVGDRLRPTTKSPAALNALQTADALIKQPNDSGLEGAIDKYKEAIEQDPRFAAAYAGLAVALCRLNAIRRDPAALDLAEANAKAALNYDPNLVEGHQALSYVYENRGLAKKALSEISHALALDPANPRTLVWQGEQFFRLNRLNDAEQTFRRVTRERPNYWVAHNELGGTFDAMCHYKEALKSYRLASLASPKNVMPLTNVAAIQLKLGQYGEAQQNLERSLQIQPTALAALNMAQLFRSTGRVGEALPMARKAVELEPSGDTGWLELGDCYSADSHPTRATRQAARDAYLRAQKEAAAVLLSNPSDGPTQMNFALYLFKTETSAEALERVIKAEAAGALDPDSQLTKVRILDLLGKRDDAITALAALFRKGVTAYQVDFIADLQSLRRDPRYLAISQPKQP